MAKPASIATWATDTNFTSGPAVGQPTKVSPAGWPNTAQGSVPGAASAAEFLNILHNLLCQWMAWQNDGTSAAQTDAHVLETDSDGETAVRAITVTDGVSKTAKMAAADGMTWRQGTVPDASGDIEGTDADSWWCTNPTGTRNFDLLEATAAIALVDGQRTSIGRGATGNFAIILHREGVGGALVTLPSLTHCSAEFEARGGRWILLDTSIAAVPGADAGP